MGGWLAGCGGKQPAALPTVGTPEYQRMVSAFYTGVLALQAGVNTNADSEARRIAGDKLLEATRLVPQEPAAWADLGVYRMESNDLTSAKWDLDRAHTLAPNNSQIEAFNGALEKQQNNLDQAVAHLRRAIELDPKNVRARYALVEALQQQTGTGTEIQDQLQKILETHPDNLAARVELALTAAQNGNPDLLRQTLQSLRQNAAIWPASARTALSDAEKAAAGPDERAAVGKIMVLRNVLRPVPAYRQSADALRAQDLLERFLVLPNPSPTPAPPDETLSFNENSIETTATTASVVRRLPLAPELPLTVAQSFRLAPVPPSQPSTLIAAGREVRVITPEGSTTSLPFPGGPKATPPTPDGVLPIDMNYSFRLGLALAGAGGVRLYRQTEKGAFVDVTARSGLPAAILNGAYTGAWAVDIESDGDLDIVLAPVSGPPLVLRNNGDGTWNVLHPFSGAGSLRAFAWGDLNADGVADAALLDAQGHLSVFENQRAGHFRAWTVPPDLGKLTAITIADADRDGVLDLVALKADGAIVRISRHPDDNGWDTAEIARWPEAPADGSARLLWADLDNNGGLDLIATGRAGSKIWLSDAQGNLKPLAAPLTARMLSVVLPSTNGRLDLAGLSASGQPVQLANRGTKNYHWQDVQPRAAYVNPHESSGDNRINSFGVGGEMEIRAGLLYAKQPIPGPILHFGLGDYAQVDAVRIIWPNGTPRAEFGWKGDQRIVAEQRLGGSCPWLFAFNGKGMKLVTDCIWRSPLGLRINAQSTADTHQTEDWVKIRGDQLVAQGGAYDLSITAELWETHYFDYLALMTVDHPAGTDIFVDERFAIPQPPLALYATAPPHPVARAVDDRGNDVTEILRADDGRYLDTFGRGPYQGITRDHWVALDLGADAPSTGPLWLVAKGWIHPTDSSINVAISQGQHDPPRGLSLEIPDGKGGWKVAQTGLGFPEGKVKTVLINLTGLFPPGRPRRLRLRTNLELYWDSIRWAAGLPNTPLKKQRLLPGVADLRYRGFSVARQADRSSPEIPDYDHLCSTRSHWLDLEGYYTRFGDVRPLLARVDDRYVIMNAGDELFLRFPVPPPPPTGWTRDFVLIGDGWEKDGNLNTTFSKTVLPLPFHAQKGYDTPPGALRDDPVYRHHAQDWRDFHTRYITARSFLNAMKPTALNPLTPP